MSKRLEIWTIVQKWMTMNENVKKRREKNKKGVGKYENGLTNHSFICICTASFVANINVMYV